MSEVRPRVACPECQSTDVHWSGTGYDHTEFYEFECNACTHGFDAEDLP